MIKIISGNIFTTQMQTVVNTINCVGIMGAGIAYEFKLRYPEMYERYVELCKSKHIAIGKLWIYKADDKWILNFPTKNHWKYPSKIEYLEKGLQKFLDTYESKGITSIAFPTLGASHGGIPVETSIQIMEKYLSRCKIEVEIYKYDASAYDDLFLTFKNKWLNHTEKELISLTGLRSNAIKKISVALENQEIKSLSRLLTVKGIGDKTLTKAFAFIRNYSTNGTNNTLF